MSPSTPAPEGHVGSAGEQLLEFDTPAPGDYLEGATSVGVLERLQDERAGTPSSGVRWNASEETALDVDGEDEEPATEASGLLGDRRRSTRSRSKSQRRKLPWWRRPSPYWFMPGSLVMAMSFGMIMSPKVEIFNQLICRALGPERTGIASPPPLSSGDSIFIDPTPRHNPINSTMLLAFSTSSSFVLDGGPDDAGSDNPDDKWAKQCRKSPVVSKAVASLSLTLVLLAGILSAITTGQWGAFGDRRGRKPVLSAPLFGAICYDAVFLITVKYHDVVGYRFLLIGPILDGLFGGLATAMAAANAYISDCTPAGSRVQIFSIVGALSFAGIMLGPTLGSLLIAGTGTVLAPFYVAITMHITYLFLLVFVVPESLSLQRQQDARARHKEENHARKELDAQLDAEARENGVVAMYARHAVRELARPFYFLKPLALLFPRKRGNFEKEEDRPVLERRGPIPYGWDFTLTKMGAGYAFYIMIVAAMGVKILYTGFKYSWGPKENGYFLSFIGGCRVLCLIVILPLGIKILRRPPPVPATLRPSAPEDSAVAGGKAGDSAFSEAQKEWDDEAKYLKVVHDAHFDLRLARFSIVVDALGYVLMATNGGRPAQFLMGCAVQSLGSGAGPAMQSLALSMASPRDSGRVLAALSVLQSLMSSVIGPLVFSSVYINSVDSVPELVFWVAVGFFAISLVIFSFVRLRRKVVDGEALATGIQVAVDVPAPRRRRWRRGRSPTPKQITESAITLREEE